MGGTPGGEWWDRGWVYDADAIIDRLSTTQPQNERAARS